MVRLAGNNSGVSPGLLLALLGSLSLHAGVLLLAPGMSTSGNSIPHQLKAYLLPPAPEPQAVPAPPTPAPQLATAPVKTAPRPEPEKIPVKPAVEQAAVPAPQERQEPQAAAVEQPAAAEAGSPEPVYFPAGQMDVLPQLLGEVKQDYPLRARNAGVEGYVTLSLLINERGEVDDIKVVKSQPSGFFEESAVAMLRGHRFSPGLRQGKAVKGRWEKTIRYRLKD